MNAIYPETVDLPVIQEEIVPQLEEFAGNELPKLDCTCVVDMGDPATAIADFAEKNQISLIAMPTHGYGAFRRAPARLGNGKSAARFQQTRVDECSRPRALPSRSSQTPSYFGGPSISNRKAFKPWNSL